MKRGLPNEQIILRKQWSQNRTRPTPNGEQQLEQVIARQYLIHKDFRAWNWIVIYTDNNGQSQFPSDQSLSRVRLFAIPVNCSTPGLLVHHQLLEFTQTHVHWVGDAIQPSHPLSSPSPPALNLSQLFASGGQSIGVSVSTSVLPMNTQDWSPLGWTGWISLKSKGLSRVFFTLQFKSINSSVLSFLYSPTLTSIHNYWKNHSLD